jgi:hypothetical protein
VLLTDYFTDEIGGHVTLIGHRTGAYEIYTLTPWRTVLLGNKTGEKCTKKSFMIYAPH